MSTPSVSSDVTWLSSTEAARRLGIHRTTLYQWIRDGRIPAHRFGRKIRLQERDVDSFPEALRPLQASKRPQPRQAPIFSDDDVVGVLDIPQVLGLHGRRTGSRWQERGLLPPPDAEISAGSRAVKGWKVSTLRAWHAERVQRLGGVAIEEEEL